jgi:hypothetical protein
MESAWISSTLIAASSLNRTRIMGYPALALTITMSLGVAVDPLQTQKEMLPYSGSAVPVSMAKAGNAVVAQVSLRSTRLAQIFTPSYPKLATPQVLAVLVAQLVAI